MQHSWLQSSQRPPPTLTGHGSLSPQEPCAQRPREPQVRGTAAMPSTSPCLEGLLGSPGWDVLREGAVAEKLAWWQQVLAVHTSTCCQPKKAGGVVPSLEAAGLNKPLTDPGSRQVSVELRLPELFAGTGLAWEVTSSKHDTLRAAMEEVCLDTLLFALIVAPHAVRLHPNSLKNGGRSIAILRSSGEGIVITRADCPAAVWRGVCRTLPPAHFAGASPITGGSDGDPDGSAGAAGSSGDAWAEGTGGGGGMAAGGGGGAAAIFSPIWGANRKEKEAICQRLLVDYYGKSDNWQSPSHLHRPVYEGLNLLLPKNTLRRFLEARSDIFETRDTEGKNWEFRCKQ